jgi:hypothetical protein
LRDKPSLQPFLHAHPQEVSGFTFAMLFAWREIYHYQYFFWDDCLLILCKTAPNHCLHLLQPIGNFCHQKQRELLKKIQKLSYPLKIYGITQKFCKEHADFISHFAIAQNRNDDNYIYRTNDLAFLAGKFYVNKRNHVSQFERKHSWTLSPLTNPSQEECDLFQKMAYPNPCSGSLEQEQKAFFSMIHNFAFLEQKGFAIFVQNKLAAFSIFEEMNPTTIVVHFEKAKRDYPGLYQVINKETAKYAFEHGYSYINREEDLGNPGIRQAKMGYHPIELRPSLIANFIGLTEK